MTLLLSVRFWITIGLVGLLSVSHFSAYRAGKAVVRAAWDKDIAERTVQALEAEKAARKKEQALLAQRDQLEKKYVEEKRKAAVAAAGADSELGRLRDELAADSGRACTDPTATARAVAGTRLERELLGTCAATLVQLAAEADGLEARLVGLQQYVKQVCLKQ